MNKNIVDIRKPLPQLYNLENFKGGVRIKYLKQLMKLIDKHKIKDNKILNIYLNEKGELMPLWVETNNNKNWLMIASYIITEKKKRKLSDEEIRELFTLKELDVLRCALITMKSNLQIDLENCKGQKTKDQKYIVICDKLLNKFHWREIEKKLLKRFDNAKTERGRKRIGKIFDRLWEAGYKGGLEAENKVIKKLIK